MNLVEKQGEELWVTHRKLNEIEQVLVDRIGNIAKEQAELRTERLVLLEKWQQVLNLRMGELMKIDDRLQHWDAADEQELALIKQYKGDVEYKKFLILWNLERLEGGRSPRIRFGGKVVTRQEAHQSIEEAEQLMRDWLDAAANSIANNEAIDAARLEEEVPFEAEPADELGDEQEAALVE